MAGGPEGEFLNYRELAHQLVEYVKETGFSHIELLPITGTSLRCLLGLSDHRLLRPRPAGFAPDDFRYFMDYCHQHDVGVILDWSASALPRTLPVWPASMAKHCTNTDPQRGEHLDWGTLIFNFGRYG